MKKLCAFLLMALLMVPVLALADDIILPDPGYYFGREYNGSYIEFDEYPYEEYNAYVTLLTNQYGMQVESAYSGKSDEFYFLRMPDVEFTRTFIGCYKNSDGCGIEAYFDNGISLEPLDVYGQQPDTESPASNSGQIAWDDGRMIADPGDFLGYEIECFEIADDTKVSTKGYMKYRYKPIPVDDILAFAEAIDASPLFERNSDGIEGKYYWLFCYDYTGNDAGLVEQCEEGRAENRRRKSDLSIYIFEPYAAESEFAIYEYPGFTVNSSMNTEYEDNDQVGDRCSFCGGDGICDECGGDSWVWTWEWVFVNGSPKQELVNKFCEAIYCNGGACSKCGGDGWR